MMNLKLQNMKQAAYFDYFKSFSLNAFDTIKKLQTEFKEQIEESFFFDPAMMFKRVKTLLGSYEILIYQINDSCEFVEIPEFGNCILKIFLQIMSVIRFLLLKIVEKSNKKQDPTPFGDKTNNGQKASLNMTQTNLSHSPSIHEQQKLMYKKKQQSKYIINTLNQQLSLLEMEQCENMENSKKQLKTLIQGKQKLQSIEISQNENILSEALNSFCKKGEHLKTFVNIRQAAMITNMKEGVGEYMKLKDILDEDSNSKLFNASTKLQSLFKTHTVNYLKEKQAEMTSQQVQVHFQEPLENKILQENKHIKKLNDIIRKLNDEMGFELQKAKSLQNLLKSKTEEFQLKTMEYRVAKIEMDNLKAKTDKILQTELSQANSGSRRELCCNCQNKISSSASYKKSQIDCISKSIIEGSQENEQALNSEETDRRTDDLLQNPSRLMEKMTRRVHYQNPSSLTRKQLAFKPLDTKSDELEIYSLTWELKVQPEIGSLNKKQSTKKRTIIGRVNTINNANNMNSTYSYRDQRRMKTKMLTNESKISCMEIQRVINVNFPGVKLPTSGGNNNDARLLGVKKISKILTQEGRKSQIEGITIQISQKWLGDDSVNENFKGITCQGNNFVSDQSPSLDYPFNLNRQQKVNSLSPAKYSPTKSLRKQKQELSPQKGSEHAFMLTKKASSKSHNQLLLTHNHPSNISTELHPNQIQTTIQQQNEQNYSSASRLALTNNQPFIKENLKFPKFLKFSNQQRVSLTMKDLINLFFDINTAKNFEYVNLFQTDDPNRIGFSAIKGRRKTNQALGVNIQQLQKKNFINGLVNKVKGDVGIMVKTSTSYCNTNMQALEVTKASNKQSPYQTTITEFPSMNCTFSGTLMRTQFWNQFANDPTVPQQQQQIDYLVRCYDFQSLVAMLFKQLRDLKRLSAVTSPQMTNQQIVRNFLRYPFSTIALQTDKTFLEKQRQDSTIEYLQLRKIMQRVFKLHKNCKPYYSHNSKKATFEKLQGMKQCADNYNAGGNDYDGEHVLCEHVVGFYQIVGVLLLPQLKSSDS